MADFTDNGRQAYTAAMSDLLGISPDWVVINSVRIDLGGKGEHLKGGPSPSLKIGSTIYYPDSSSEDASKKVKTLLSATNSDGSLVFLSLLQSHAQELLNSSDPAILADWANLNVSSTTISLLAPSPSAAPSVSTASSVDPNSISINGSTPTLNLSLILVFGIAGCILLLLMCSYLRSVRLLKLSSLKLAPARPANLSIRSDVVNLGDGLASPRSNRSTPRRRPSLVFESTNWMGLDSSSDDSSREGSVGDVEDPPKPGKRFPSEISDDTEGVDLEADVQSNILKQGQTHDLRA